LSFETERLDEAETFLKSSKQILKDKGYLSQKKVLEREIVIGESLQKNANASSLQRRTTHMKATNTTRENRKNNRILLSQLSNLPLQLAEI